jgi:hypothetical protein
MKLEYAERNVAAEIGLTGEAIRELRAKHLTKDEDWALERGLVRYTKKGREKILAAVLIPPTDAPSAPPSKPEADEATETPAPGPRGAWTLLEDQRPWMPATVEQRYHNKKVFVARLEVEPFTIVTVRVRDSEKFTVGMRVPIRAIEGNLYELASRLPRWPGKW